MSPSEELGTLLSYTILSDLTASVLAAIFEAFTSSETWKETVTSQRPDIQRPLAGPFQRVITDHNLNNIYYMWRIN